MIEAINICKSFAKPVITQILTDVSMNVPSGNWASLMGPSGSGKSTLLSLIAGLDQPSSGELKLIDTNINELSEEQRAKFRAQNLGFIFQSFRLLPSLTVEENIRVPLEIIQNDSAESHRWTQYLLESVGLGHRKAHFPTQLSGGEQQRVAVARAFANKPKILLADEPTGNLDEDNSEKILDLISLLHKESKATMLIVSHDPEVAARAQMQFKLQRGQLKQVV